MDALAHCGAHRHRRLRAWLAALRQDGLGGQRRDFGRHNRRRRHRADADIRHPELRQHSSRRIYDDGRLPNPVRGDERLGAAWRRGGRTRSIHVRIPGSDSLAVRHRRRSRRRDSFGRRRVPPAARPRRQPRRYRYGVFGRRHSPARGWRRYFGAATPSNCRANPRRSFCCPWTSACRRTRYSS